MATNTYFDHTLATRRAHNHRPVVLAFLRAFVAEHGYPPSVRDIRDGCGLSSTSVVHRTLTDLEARGYIERTAGVARGLRVIIGGNDG